jgi:ribosomal protein S10
VSYSDERFHSVLGTLEECRKVLNENNGRETAELLSIVILDLRMKLKGVDNADLRALCDEMLRGVGREPAPRSKPTPDQTRRPLLRVVK